MLAAIVVAIAISNVWLHRRAETDAEEREQTKPSEP